MLSLRWFFLFYHFSGCWFYFISMDRVLKVPRDLCGHVLKPDLMNNIDEITDFLEMAKRHLSKAEEHYDLQTIVTYNDKKFFKCLTHIDVCIDALKHVRHFMECDLEGREP